MNFKGRTRGRNKGRNHTFVASLITRDMWLPQRPCGDETVHRSATDGSNTCRDPLKDAFQMNSGHPPCGKYNTKLRFTISNVNRLSITSN